MSRCEYTDDCEDNLAIGRWMGALKKAINGKRGQALLLELIAALDAMKDKRLFPNNFATPEGEFCALGVLGAKRGIKTDDLGDAEDGCDDRRVGRRFGIARLMAAEIMYRNDECVRMSKSVSVELCGPVRPGYPEYGNHTITRSVDNDKHAEQRWQSVRDWAAENFKGTQIEPVGEL